VRPVERDPGDRAVGLVAEGREVAGRGARYTRGRGPVEVVAASRAMEKRAAYRLEWAVKQLPRRRKAAALRSKP